ncbi:MAG: hypothetical protein NVSMB27_02790 [Ktedonobacteraceae bacterium]
MSFTHRRVRLTHAGMATLLLIFGIVSSFALFKPQQVFASSGGGGFNTPGNVLISDQFNNRVVEVDRNTKQIVWSFGSGNSMLCNPGPGAIIGLNDAERLSDGMTLMPGTGIPSGIKGTKACVDNRVIVINESGTIVWQYGQAGVTGSGPNQLNVPVFAIQLPNRDIMIVDQGNNRVIQVGRFSKKVVWMYGGTGVLNNPNSAELLANGHILIADENNNRVIEITRAGQIVWEYSQGLMFAAFASRLPNGDTLITDSGHSRIVEVTMSKQVVSQYFTNTVKGSNPTPLPTNAVRLADGDTVIADQFNNRAIIIDSQKQLEFQYGMTNHRGDGFDELFGPYTAYSIGDYTGQTPPPVKF